MSQNKFIKLSLVIPKGSSKTIISDLPVIKDNFNLRAFTVKIIPGKNQKYCIVEVFLWPK